MLERRRVFTGLDSERTFGYARAVRVGDHAWVSGSTALESGGTVRPELKGNGQGQSAEAFRRIAAALAQVDLTLAHVVAVRAYVTDARHVAGYLKAHREALGDVFPAATLVGTPFLAHPDLVVEIEVEAVA